MTFPAAFLGFWPEWLLYHKVALDGPNRRIYVAASASSIDIQTELYSAWKEWALLEDNLKFLQAMRATGGDPLPGGSKLGITYFMMNGWKVVLDHSVDFSGNLFTEEGDSPFVVPAGQQLSSTVRSNLVDQIAPDPDLFPTTSTIAQGVWERATTSPATGSFGELVSKIRDSQVAKATTSVAGSTASAVRTGLTEADGWWDGFAAQVIDGAISSVRHVELYEQSNGTLHLTPDLPFAPSSGAVVLLLAGHRILTGAAR